MKIHLLLIPLFLIVHLASAEVGNEEKATPSGPTITLVDAAPAKKENKKAWTPAPPTIDKVRPAFEDQWKRIEAVQQSMRDLAEEFDSATKEERLALEHQFFIKREFRDDMIEKYFEELETATLSSMDGEFGIKPRHKIKED